MSGNSNNNSWPTERQQKALAYAPKPFAALSFLSCAFVMYYLLIRYPEKRKRMYHRLILSTFCCFMPLSVAIFWGTWAMPEGTAYAVGAAGTSATCSIQGFVIITCFLAFPFYYASFSVFAYVAVKNNFQEEKYAWMEKWIHFGAYLLPVTLAIVAAIEGWISPGLSFCHLDVTCDIFDDLDCAHEEERWILAPCFIIIGTELVVGTLVIVYLLCKFDSFQKDLDEAVGLRQMIETARKRRLHDVALQTGLYLASFWFGYIPIIADAIYRLVTHKINYGLVAAAHCLFGLQGFIILVIYFALMNRRRRDSFFHVFVAPETNEGGRGRHQSMMNTGHETVAKIRENAANPRRVSRRSSMDQSRFSFHIFDGSPADDSPWAQYVDENSSVSDTGGTILEDEDRNSLATSLLDSPGRKGDELRV